MRPQSTSHRTRNSITDTFLEVLRKERVFWYFKTFKEIFVQNYSFFFTVASLQFRISGFNKIKLIEKCFLWLFSGIVANLPEKWPIMKPFYWSKSVTILNLHASEKNHFIHFPEDAQKSCCFERFRKIQENRLK